VTPPLVSILIPCRNAAPWLKDCLDSAFAQTWPRCEIILVDDGSTDASPGIARRFLDRGLQIISGPARNAAAARNCAYAHCKGSFIQYLDADDLLDPDKIEKQMHLLLQHPPATLASGVWIPFVSSPEVVTTPENPAFRDFLNPVDFLIQHYNGGGMMQPGAWLTPRTLIEKAGPWNENLTLNDDGEFFARVILASNSIRFCPDAMCHYRRGHGRSLSRHTTKSALQSLYLSIELNTAAMLAHQNNPGIHQAVCNAWWKLSHELHPALPSLSRKAEQLARQHGTPTRPFECGPRMRIAASLFGWRIAQRLKSILHPAQ
jgi:glycosyltransferase involved in cell wall biosynthesis